VVWRLPRADFDATTVLECERIFGEVLKLGNIRVSYVLNNPLPYATVSTSELAAATGTPWTEISHGGEEPSTAAVRGESLFGTHPKYAVTRAAIQLAELVSNEARELAAMSGRPV
jgi:hypothetical protein